MRDFHSRVGHSEAIIVHLKQHPEFHIIIWFLGRLGFQWNHLLIDYAKEVNETVDLRVADGFFKPDYDLNEIRGIIARCSNWKAAGCSTNFLLKLADDVVNYLAQELAMWKDKTIEVEHLCEFCLP
jgi:hypothetical protein